MTSLVAADAAAMSATGAEPSPSGTYPSGTVVSYTPDPSRHDPRWCREGMAVADDRGLLFDTYWNCGDNHLLLPVELATVYDVWSLADYDELPDRRVDLWNTYHHDDRQMITSQHGLRRRLFVRKGASPNLDTQITNAADKVREAEKTLCSAQRGLALAREELARLQALEATPETEASDD